MKKKMKWLAGGIAGAVLLKLLSENYLVKNFGLDIGWSAKESSTEQAEEPLSAEQSQPAFIPDPEYRRFAGYTIDPLTVKRMLQSLRKDENSIAKECAPDMNLTEAWNRAQLYTPDSELRKARPDIFWARNKTFIKEPSNLESENAGMAGVFFFRNALVTGHFPAIWDCRTESLFVPRRCTKPKDKFHAFPSIKHQTFWSSSVERMTEQPVVLIWQFWGDEYFHSMAECLPRLGYVIEYLQAHPSALIMAGQKFLRSRSQEFNRLLNLTNRWIPYRPSMTYWIEELLVPSGTPCGHMDPTNARVLQYRTAETLQPIFRQYEAAMDKPSKPVILLHKRSSRRIVNHDELLAALVSNFPDHYVEQFFGNENLTQSALLHYLARVVVGPHGAGFSNILFCRRQFHNETAKPLVGLVELHQQYGNWNGGQPNMCHQKTARSTGLATVLVRQTDGSKFTNFRVNVSQAVEAVRDMLVRLA